MFAAMAQLAVDTGGGAIDSPFTYLTGLGFPGIIIGLLITGQLRIKPEVDRLVKDLQTKDDIIKLKDQQIEALQTGIVDKAIPALTRSTQILEQLPSGELMDHAKETQREIAELQRRLERLGRGQNES